MIEFDIKLDNLRLRVNCEDYKKELITELMSGHAYIEPPHDKSTYNLILRDSLSKNTKGTYIKMIDKWFDNASCDVWIDNINKTIYMGNIQASDIKWKNSLIKYFACNVFNRLLEEIGYIAFHSSCVDKKGIGLAFIAPRNSGKTNCMLNLMDVGYNSVTNDKLAIMYDGHDLRGYGVAQEISIRVSPSFRKQKRNEKYLKFIEEQNVVLNNKNTLEGNKIILDSILLANINNVSQIPTTKIKHIFYPQYNSKLTNAKFELLSLKELKKLLIEQRLPLVHDTKAFFREIKTTNSPLFDEETTLKKIMELQSYVVIQGENTRNDFVEKIDKKIKNLEYDF